MKQILFFEEIDRSMLSQVGGKGANLGEMTQAGFPVPEGFCLTTEEYDAFSEGLELESMSGEEARSILEKRSLSGEQISGLEESLARFDDGTLFSVRSSATAEDLPYASFAGQQDTYINVKKKDVAEAVKKCFISLYTDRAVSYRQQNGIADPSMSVVVQKMVDSEKSGVMFTADPVSGNRNRLVIDAIFGQGEAIVSGLVSPDHIVYDRKKEAVTSTDIALKEFAIQTLLEGGTYKDEIHSKEPVLTDSEITQLAKLGASLEKHYGAPQDIEWAIEKGNVYILQTRAITSLYPAPEIKDDRYHFLFNIGYQQMNPNAMPAMALDCLLGAVNIKGESLEEFKPFMVYAIGQHIFLDFSRLLWFRPARKFITDKMMMMMDPLLSAGVKELLANGDRLQPPDPALRIIGKKAMSAIPKALRSDDPARTAAEAVEILEKRSDKAIAEIRVQSVTPHALPVIFRDCMAIHNLAEPFMPTIMTGIVSLKRLEKIEEKMGCKGKWTEAIQTGITGNIVTDMNLHIGDLADLAAADEEVMELLKNGGEDIQGRLMDLDNEFGNSYREFMKLYGFRCAGELDISKPRWSEDPAGLISQILALAVDKEPGSHRRDYEERNRKAYEQGDELIRAIEDRYGSKKAKKARSMLDKFLCYYPKREHFKYYWMRTFSAVRDKLLDIGTELVSRGQIDNRDDIMHLHMMDVYNGLKSRADLRPLVRKNRTEFERISRLTPPRILTSEGEVVMGKLSAEGLPEGALPGLGVSAGCVEGIARVIADPAGATLEKGEILIAPFTDPGWTPLFVNAAAVVTEIGGTLTHGAVVAREYGIPGVVGVTDATKLIKSGQKIRVDGSAGYVLILE